MEDVITTPSRRGTWNGMAMSWEPTIFPLPFYKKVTEQRKKHIASSGLEGSLQRLQYWHVTKRHGESSSGIQVCSDPMILPNQDGTEDDDGLNLVFVNHRKESLKGKTQKCQQFFKIQYQSLSCLISMIIFHVFKNWRCWYHFIPIWV